MAGQVNPITTFIGTPGVYGSAGDPRFLPPNLDRDRVPVSLLDQRHPEFEARYDAWIDLALLYEGGSMLKARSERLLKKRPREDEEVYAARMDRFTYQNILGTGLGWYGAAMFDTPPEIFFDSSKGSSAGSAFFLGFLKNCDGIGTDYIDFWKRVFQFMLTYGAAWILTDLVAIAPGEEPPQSLEEERVRGLLDPHIAAYTPLNAINWREDDRGKLQWVVLKTEVEEQEFLAKREIVSTWYYYDKDEYRVYEDRRSPEEQVRIANNVDSNRMAKLLRQGKHALSGKRVPVRKVTLSEGLWLANRAYLLLVDHLNQDNTLGWALFMSNLAIPVVIGDVDASNMTYSEVGYLQFPSGTTYTWTEPAGNSFIHSAKRVDSLREECFRSMNLQAQGRSMHATPAMQSGRSKQLEMSPAKQILAGMGDDLRRHMQDVLTDVRDARREDGQNPDVRGFTFQEDMTTEEVFAVNSVLSIRIPSKKFEKYLYKKVARAWMVDANREELDEVYKEIDKGQTMEEREEDEFKKRVDLAKQNIKGVLAAPKGPTQPPGRGGAGPSPAN